MQRLALCILTCLVLLCGCGPSEDKLTPEQAAHLDILRQATIKQLETMFGRSLTDVEKQCVVVKVRKGKLDSRIVPPLSETLKAWHGQAQTKPS